MLGVDLHVVVYDHPDRRVARLFRRNRECKGLKIMSVREAARVMPHALRRGCVGIVGDRDFTGQGLRTEYLGVEATVPGAYAGLAAARGIRVIPSFCLRVEGGKYRLLPGRPEVIEGGGSAEPREIVEKCLRIFEKCVEKYPEQWYFFQKVGGQGVQE
jgi:lauroyl/myristoyl acyltransferase